MSSRLSTCDVAQAAERQTAEVLELERHRSGRWRVHETTVTDMIVALFSGAELPDLWIDTPDEKLTGGDIDLIVFDASQNRGIRVIIQAKRADEVKTKNPYFWYRELFHPNGSGGQCRDLLAYCYKENAIPLYAFYHPRTLANVLDNSKGISLCHAEWIGRETRKKNNRSNMKTCHYDRHSFEFHQLFCISGSQRQIVDLEKFRKKLTELSMRTPDDIGFLERTISDSTTLETIENRLQRAEVIREMNLEYLRDWAAKSEYHFPDSEERQRTIKTYKKIVVGVPDWSREDRMRRKREPA